MGPAKGLLPGADQKCFGRGPAECIPGGGVFWEMSIKVVMRHIYLGGFIEESEAEKRWLAGKVMGRFSASTRSPHMLDCRSHSSKSWYLCSGLTQALATLLDR